MVVMTGEQVLWSLILVGVVGGAIGVARLLVWLEVRNGDRW